MPELGWQYVLPCDFSDQFQIELFGWVKTGAYDISFEHGFYMRNGVGSADPLCKYAAQTCYSHEELGLEVLVMDYFDQGIVYLIWQPIEKNETAFVAGRAIKVDNRWRVVQKDETFFWSGMEKKLIKGREAIVRVGLSIYKNVPGQLLKEICKVEIIRKF